MKILIANPPTAKEPSNSSLEFNLKIASISKKTTFDIILFLGYSTTTSSNTWYINQQSNSSIKTNSQYLGSHGIFTTAEGLCIAYIDDLNYTDALLQSSKNITNIDIFISPIWPSNLGKNLSDEVAQLAYTLQPRYHFSPGTEFLESIPYSNHSVQYPTRFIGLAPYGNSQKLRWNYAMNIDPISKLSDFKSLTLNTTISQNPFSNNSNYSAEKRQNFFYEDSQNRVAKKQKTLPENYICKICDLSGHWIKDCPQKKAPQLPEGYICNICHNPGHFIRDCPDSNKNPQKHYKKSVRNDGQCWFCLSNPNIEKHLIVDIGENSYVALAKGGLVDWGGHLLIIPIEHIESTRQIQVSENLQVLKEIEEFKTKISKVYTQRGEIMLCLEMFGGDQGHGTSLQHLHIQMIPISLEAEPQIETIFEQEASLEGLEMLAEGLLPESLSIPFCRVEIPTLNGNEVKTMVFVPTKERLREFKILQQESESKGKRPPRLVNVNFARKVACQILGQPEKVDWKNCVQTEEEEVSMVQFLKTIWNS